MKKFSHFFRVLYTLTYSMLITQFFFCQRILGKANEYSMAGSAVNILYPFFSQSIYTNIYASISSTVFYSPGSVQRRFLSSVNKPIVNLFNASEYKVIYLHLSYYNKLPRGFQWKLFYVWIHFMRLWNFPYLFLGWQYPVLCSAGR